MDRTTRLHNQVHRLSRHMCGGGVEECGRLTELLDKIEDERAHREAEKLRAKAVKVEQSPLASVDPGVVLRTTSVLRTAAEQIDPYEKRDGQLVHKITGEPVTR